MRPGLLVIGGPTASGKSALALRLAEALDGEIVNADSMQLYRGLSILTARPDPAATNRVPHHLYGVLDPAEPGSVACWLTLAERVISEISRRGHLPIVVGGTGLYLEALLAGLAPIPEVPAAVRRAARARLEALGPAGLHRELARLDPDSASRLRAGDSQRVTRAFEVALGTRRPLSAWQRLPPRRPDLPAPPRGYLLIPPRPALHARIEARLRAMIEAGALREVEALLARRLDPALPVMKAVGVRALAAHLKGETTLAEAFQQTLAQTRQFAKRQLTWFRHRFPGLVRIEGFGDDPAAAPAVHTVRELVLTGV